MVNKSLPITRDESIPDMWLFIIVNTLILAIIVNIFGVSLGIVEVTAGLFLLPVVIAAYWYPTKGMLFSFFVSAVYVVIIYFFTNGSPPALVTAVFKCVIIVGVSAVVSSLAQNMQKSEAKYRGIFSSSEAGTGLINTKDLKILEVNQRFTEILDYTPEEITKISFSDLWVESSKRNLFFTLLNNDASIESFETQFYAKTREVRWVLLAAGILPDNQFVCTMVNITDRKQLEEAQRQALEQIDKNIEQLAILGDHIRNPLAVIIGLTCMLAEDIANKVLFQAREIDRIITQLDMGWIESEKVRNIIKRYYGIGEQEAADPKNPIKLSEK